MKIIIMKSVPSALIPSSLRLILMTTWSTDLMKSVRV